MPAFILFVENEVTSQADAPVTPEIEAALLSIPPTGLPPGSGFVGPARVTRIARLGVPGGRITRVGWLYQWPEVPGSPEHAHEVYTAVVRYILTSVTTLLPASRGWHAPVALPYDPVSNGTVEWWRSGDASHTITRDIFDLNMQIGSNSSFENPTGPLTIRPPSVNPFDKVIDAVNATPAAPATAG